MRTAAFLLVAVLSAGCAHQREETREIDLRGPPQGRAQVVEAERVAEAAPAAAPLQRPDASIERLARFGRRPAPSGEMIEILPDAARLTYADLFRFVSDRTGIRIRHEEHNAVIKSKLVPTVGPRRVAEGDLVAWMQDAAAYDGLIVVPYGPADRREFAAFDMANPHVSQHAQAVDEDELPALAGRTGLYVSCVLSLPEGLDPARVRQALSQLSTRTSALGRVNDVGEGEGLLVADFANVVANMRRMIDELAVTRWEASRAPR